MRFRHFSSPRAHPAADEFNDMRMFRLAGRGNFHNRLAEFEIDRITPPDRSQILDETPVRKEIRPERHRNDGNARMPGKLDTDRVELRRVKNLRACSLRKNHDGLPLCRALLSLLHDSPEIVARIGAVHGNASEIAHDVAEIRDVEKRTLDDKAEFAARPDERMHQRGFQQTHMIADDDRGAGETREIVQPAQMDLSAAAFDDPEVLHRVVSLLLPAEVICAAGFSGINENMLYVEGWSISKFLRGEISLLPHKNNKIGIIFDRAIPEKVLNIHLNTMNAVKTVYGADIIGYEITKECAGVEFFAADSGISTGALKFPETLLEAGKKLLEKGAQALAVVAFFDEPPEDEYENGTGVDIVGGVEGVISHYLSKNLLCPCAHAPAFADTEIRGDIVDSKVSAEYITPTFLPCILLGLKNAPLIRKFAENGCITYKNLHSVVMPYDSLGSGAVFDAIERKIPVYAVKENKTVLNITGGAINLQNDIIEIDTYDEYIKILQSGEEYV